MLRKTLRYFLKFILGFVLFVVFYITIAFVLSLVPSVSENSSAPKNIEIFILSNGVHTDFVLPVKSEFKDWSEIFPFNDFVAANETCHYIAIGWGDKGFYIDTPTWADLKASTAFKADRKSVV